MFGFIELRAHVYKYYGRKDKTNRAKTRSFVLTGPTICTIQRREPPTNCPPYFVFAPLQNDNLALFSNLWWESGGNGFREAISMTKYRESMTQ